MSDQEFHNKAHEQIGSNIAKLFETVENLRLQVQRTNWLLIGILGALASSQGLGAILEILGQ